MAPPNPSRARKSGYSNGVFAKQQNRNGPGLWFSVLFQFQHCVRGERSESAECFLLGLCPAPRSHDVIGNSLWDTVEEELQVNISLSQPKFSTIQAEEKMELDLVSANSTLKA